MEILIDRDVLSQLLEAAEVRRDQWAGVADSRPPLDLVDELYEADSEEAGQIAARLTEQAAKARLSISGPTSYLVAEAAADLWEWALDLHSSEGTKQGPVTKAFEAYGTAEIRCRIISAAADLCRFYESVGRNTYFEKLDLLSYDWDIVPAIAAVFFDWATLEWLPFDQAVFEADPDIQHRADAAQLETPADCTVRHLTCKHCALDIEGTFASGEWRDRGNNQHCPTEAGDAGQKHEPLSDD